jgi:myo-inositol-1(or 4)-monophosphatase
VSGPGPAEPTSRWLELCRAAAADVRAVLAELPTREARERVVGRGAGGDLTKAIDLRAETAVLAHFRGDDVRIVSEEAGVQGDGRYTVVVDPIDGSQNCERGIPYFALSVAIAEGETMEDVFLGYVYDFGSGEEWTAVKGGGAFLDGRPLTGTPGDAVEILSIEATAADLVAERLPHLAPLADKVRVMGALAISLCHLAAGRTDAVVSLKGARAVDIAAGQLLVRERGFAVDLPESPPFGSAPLDLVGRSRVVGAGNPELCRRVAQALLE